MALTKAQKQKVLEDLKNKIEKEKSVAFADISGLKVQDLTKLRRAMKAGNCELKVAKKTLIGLAFKKSSAFSHTEIGLDLKKMEGETALGFGYGDEISPFKIIYDFSKDHQKLQIIGGLVGKDYFEKEKAIELGKLPGREELLSRFVGSLSSPILGFINVLQGNIKGLITVLAKAKT